jgi:hypothetical protein
MSNQDPELLELLSIVDEIYDNKERKQFIKTVEHFNVQEAREYLIRLFDAWKEREKKYMETVKNLKAMLDNELDKP